MKKNLFSNRYIFLLAIATLFMFAACQKTEQAIRAEVEKEIILKIESSLVQTTKNVLTASETQLVINELQKTKLQIGITTPVYKFPNGRQINILVDKNLNYEMFVESEGKQLPALTITTIPIKYDKLVSKYLNAHLSELKIPFDIKCYPFKTIEPCIDPKCVADLMAIGFSKAAAEKLCPCYGTITEIERCFISKKN